MLKADGWTCAVVERWNPHARIRQDLFGFADLLAMKAGRVPLLVQVTSGSNVAARLAKIIAEPRALIAIRAGFAIEIHGWRKLKVARGKAAVRWMPRVEKVYEADFGGTNAEPLHGRSDCADQG